MMDEINWSELEENLFRIAKEDLCIRVMRRLWTEGVFSAARAIERLVVLGPDVLAEDVLAKKARLDDLLEGPIL
jgi:hypothetical protein